MIPVVLLHHNEPTILLRTVSRIIDETIEPYKIFIIDNNSDDTSLNSKEFTSITKFNGVVVIKNKKNNWIYGFNLALKHPDWPKSKYYVFSDADVLVPKTNKTDCWLTKLVREMDAHRCIGKLGISLNLENLKNNQKLVSTLQQEESYFLGEKIGGNIIAPVDTTMAIYRNDYFIGKFIFRIGHQSLYRPYYYTCRTEPNFNAIHIGWDFYPGSKSQSEYTIDRLRKKAYAMSLMGTHTAPEILNKLTAIEKYGLIFIRDIVRLIHLFKVTALNAVFTIKRLPRSTNEIQSRARVRIN